MKRPYRVFAAFLASVAISAVSVAEMPVFLIVADGASFVERARAIEAAGARVRQRVPPRIVVADLPSGLKLSSLPGVQSAYTAAVPVSVLEPQGPAAVAAGLQWNRRLLSTARAAGAMALGSMRQTLSDRSLSAPSALRLTPASGGVACAWEPVDGAVYYEVQVSASPDFSSASRTHSVRTNVTVPAQGAVYVRARAIDPGEPAADDDVFGRWSEAASASAPAPAASTANAPTPTSPADKLETEGFTLILEWTPGDGATRVQVARDETFTDVVFDEVVTGGEYACPGPALRTGDRLWWRVQGRADGATAWSAARRAKIGAPRSEKVDGFVNPEAPR